ncbi:MAG: mechanosensitive ion channel family protein [Prevotellaceae bacterium]|jgi:small-conductance mechanosensitive channel|nr:mechanosensitive ion channel family protein [Prevotellaceae bacterium]
MNVELIKIIISTVFVIVVYPVARFVAKKLIENVAKFNSYDEGRTKMIGKTINVLIVFVIATILISIWGVDTKNLLLALSSVFAVIGVALFAQWSILSNVTAGIVIYFTLQLKIGDRIKIYDKDFPIEATLIDIRTFYVYLKTDEGERITYPNNLILQKGISINKASRSTKNISTKK